MPAMTSKPAQEPTREPDDAKTAREAPPVAEVDSDTLSEQALEVDNDTLSEQALEVDNDTLSPQATGGTPRPEDEDDDDE